MSNKTMNQKLLLKLVLTGLMAALVFLFSHLSIPIPNPLLKTRIHLGNVMCVLSGLMLGGPFGGLAAGFGSCLYDLFDPAYITSAPFTLVFKFLLAYVCGKVAYFGGRNGKNLLFNILGGISGSLVYLVLHIAKVFLAGIWVQQIAVPAALIAAGSSALTSLVNAVLAVIIAIPLSLVLKTAVEKSRLDW